MIEFNIQSNISRDINGFAFPPFSIIGRVIKKVEEEGGLITAVVPRWSTKLWYPRLLEMTRGEPLLLPKDSLYLPQTPRLKHPLQSMRLIACQLEGLSEELIEFLLDAWREGTQR